MELGGSDCMIGLITMGISSIISFMGLGCLTRLKGITIKENFCMGNFMVRACWLGLTLGSMKGISKMGSTMVRGGTNTQMGSFTWVATKGGTQKYRRKINFTIRICLIMRTKSKDKDEIMLEIL